MKYLQEMLSILTESQQLDENLGNLNKIDRAFKNLLVLPGHKKIKNAFGSKSRVEPTTIKKADHVFDLLETPESVKYYKGDAEFGKKDMIKGVVWLHPTTNKQIAMVTRDYTKGQYSSFDESYSVGFIYDNMPEIHDTVTVKQIRELLKEASHIESTYITAGKIKKSPINKVLSLIFSTYKNLKNPITSGLLVYEDHERTNQRNARYELKLGMVPITFANDKQKADYLSSLKHVLNVKLNTLKKSKAFDYGTNGEEILNNIKEHGFLEKIKISGMNYKQRTMNNFSFTNLQTPGKDTWTGYAEMEYQLEDEKSHEQYKLRREIHDVLTDILGSSDGLSDIEKEEYVKQYNALYHKQLISYFKEGKLTPDNIRFRFKFDKGLIVPYEVGIYFSGENYVKL